MTEPLVPDFIIGGAPRAGTTFLAQALASHPRIAMAQPLRPEPKVFLDARTPEQHRQRYAQWFGDAQRDLVRGEKSTNYFENDDAPGRVAAALPGVRMIFVLREPVERAYSNWLWSRMNGLDDLPFAEAVELEGQRPDPLRDERPHARPHAYLSRGDYGRFARRWIEALGTESVGLFLYEDLFDGHHAEATLASIQRFAGVEPAALDLPVSLVNEARQSGDELDDATRARLRERMRPLVAELAQIADVDVSRWGY